MMIDVNVIQDQIAWLNQRDASYGGTTTVLLIHFAVKVSTYHTTRFISDRICHIIWKVLHIPLSELTGIM